jgi:hypothetical protein
MSRLVPAIEAGEKWCTRGSVLGEYTGIVFIVGLDLLDTKDIEYSEPRCGSLLNVKILSQVVPPV